MSTSLPRYLGFVISCVALLIGVIWAAFDAQKQGWHDRIAGTYVVKAWRPHRALYSGLTSGMPLDEGHSGLDDHALMPTRGTMLRAGSQGQAAR
jgi:hypothetical protein